MFLLLHIISVNKYAIEKYGFVDHTKEIEEYVLNDVPPVSEPIKSIVKTFDDWVAKYGLDTYK